MEGIPAPDVADYKRRKEQELGLPAGSISGSGKGLPQNKRPRIENRILSEDELRAQLQAHKALMGGGDAAPVPTPAHGGAVYNAAPQTYATPPAPPAVPPFPPGMMPPPPGAGPFPGGPPPPGFPGQPPFPPFPPGPGFPPGYVTGLLMRATYPLTHALHSPPPPGFPFPPPGVLRPGQTPVPPGAPPFSPGGAPPPPPGVSASPPAPGSTPQVPQADQAPITTANTTSAALPTQAFSGSAQSPYSRTALPPNPPQTNPALKAGTVLVWQDANYSPASFRKGCILVYADFRRVMFQNEKRAEDTKYHYVPEAGDEPTPKLSADGPRGTKRARAEDFL